MEQLSFTEKLLKTTRFSRSVGKNGLVYYKQRLPCSVYEVLIHLLSWIERPSGGCIVTHGKECMKFTEKYFSKTLAVHKKLQKEYGDRGNRGIYSFYSLSTDEMNNFIDEALMASYDEEYGYAVNKMLT